MIGLIAKISKFLKKGSGPIAKLGVQNTGILTKTASKAGWWQKISSIKFKGALSRIFKILDLGVTGYLLYSIFNDDEKSEDSMPVINEANGRSYLEEVFSLPDEVAFESVLLAQASDYVATITLLKRSAISMMSDDDAMISSGFLSLAAYITTTPSQSTHFNHSEIKDMFEDVLKSIDDKADDEGFKKAIEEYIDDLDLSSMDLVSLKRLDFVLYYLTIWNNSEEEVSNV